jgi:hypothetical protein
MVERSEKGVRTVTVVAALIGGILAFAGAWIGSAVNATAQQDATLSGLIQYYASHATSMDDVVTNLIFFDKIKVIRLKATPKEIRDAVQLCLKEKKCG